jgi:hypothetical protein
MFERNTNVGFDFNWSRVPDSNITKRNITVIHDFLQENKKNVDWNNIYNINGIPIYLNREEENIAITLSGGADSSMLLFLLCSLIEDLKINPTIHAITMVRFWRDRIYIEDLVANVIGFINSRFPNIKIKSHFGFIPTALETTPLENLNFRLDPAWSGRKPDDLKGRFADVYAVGDYSDYVCSRNNIGYSYTGTTTNPEHHIALAPEFRNVKEIDPNRYSYQFFKKIGKNTFSMGPFEYIQKNWVMAQYENFGLEDYMMMTRSCEGGKHNMDLTFGPGKWTAEGSKYVCGRCFFCNERSWALDSKMPFLIKK